MLVKTTYNIGDGRITAGMLTYNESCLKQIKSNRMVYVIDIHGKALMPTSRHGKVRRLLRKGLAHVAKRIPFTIQLDYETTSYTQDVSLGVDAGGKHIGISATTIKRELFASEIELRTDIVNLISSRRELRKTRRSRKTRYRKARFDNRKRIDKRFSPSVQSIVDRHINAIKLAHEILPVSKTTIEVAQFDTQKLKNPDIQGKEYQEGEQLCFWNVREYILARDGHKCQHCKGKSKDSILNVHHIESRKTGGNAPNNLITLCETCHKAYHRGEIDFKFKRGKSLRDVAVMNIMRWAVYDKAKSLFDNVHLTYGYIIKHMRISNGISKSKSADAFCISGNVKATRIETLLKCKCVARHTRALHVCNPKKGGIRRSAIASHWIGKSRLQRYDYVEWNGIKCFIFGSSHGRPILRDIDCKLATQKQSVRAQEVKFLMRKSLGVIAQYVSSDLFNQ